MKPKFTRALKELELNPKETLEKYKGDPEVMPVLQKLMVKMGEGFQNSKLLQHGKTSPGIEEVGGTRSTLQKAKPTPEQMQRWMSDPIVRSALECPEVQDIIQRAHRSPDLLKEYMEHPKIKILIDNGVITMNL